MGFIDNLLLRFNSSKEALAVKSLDNAIAKVQIFLRQKEFQTALFLANELLLKARIAQNYHEQREKKLSLLATTNIEALTKTSKEKHKQALFLVRLLQERVLTVQNLITLIEKQQRIFLEKREQEKKTQYLKDRIREVQDFLNKGDVQGSLLLAQKLVSDFPESEEAGKIFDKTQKLFFKRKKQADKDQEASGNLIKLTKEAQKELQEKNELGGVSGFRKMMLTWQEWKHKQQELKLLEEKQKNLAAMERLIKRAGGALSIKIDNSEVNNLYLDFKTGLSRDIESCKIPGFQFFGKINGKDKIIGDTFGSKLNKDISYFYFGDATGHGVGAGMTAALLSKLFNEKVPKVKNLPDLYYYLNNSLKEGLKSRLFVTSVLFSYTLGSPHILFAGAGHDPFFVYRKNKKTVEKIIPGGLALGVRMIKQVNTIREKELILDDGDIIFGYTDGIIEARNTKNEAYGIERLQNSFLKFAQKQNENLEGIYQGIMDDSKEFRGGVEFLDDVSLFLFQRDSKQDIIQDMEDIKNVLQEADIRPSFAKKEMLKKSKDQIIELAKQERKARELEARLKRFEYLLKLGEFLKLKNEVELAHREGFVHNKMKFYMQKALDNEYKQSLRKLEEKLEKKYNTLVDLYERGDYEAVTRDIIEILNKNGKI